MNTIMEVETFKSVPDNCALCSSLVKGQFASAKTYTGVKNLKVDCNTMFYIWYIFRWFPLVGEASRVHLYQVSRNLVIHIWNLPERIWQLEEPAINIWNILQKGFCIIVEPTISYLKSSKTDFAISRTNHDIRNIFQKGLEPREIQTGVGSGTPEILFNFVKIYLICEKYIFNYVNTHVTNVALVQSCHFVGMVLCWCATGAITNPTKKVKKQAHMISFRSNQLHHILCHSLNQTWQHFLWSWSDVTSTWSNRHGHTVQLRCSCEI